MGGGGKGGVTLLPLYYIYTAVHPSSVRRCALRLPGRTGLRAARRVGGAGATARPSTSSSASPRSCVRSTASKRVSVRLRASSTLRNMAAQVISVCVCGITFSSSISVLGRPLVGNRMAPSLPPPFPLLLFLPPVS